MYLKPLRFGLAGVATLIFAAAFLTGCEDMGQYSRSDDSIIHDTLKPPLNDGSDAGILGDAELAEFSGKVSAASETTLRITTDTGAQLEFLVTPATIVKLNDTLAALSNLKPGMKVVVTGFVQEDMITADKIDAIDEPQSDESAKPGGTDEASGTDLASEVNSGIRVDGTIIGLLAVVPLTYVSSIAQDGKSEIQQPQLPDIPKQISPDTGDADPESSDLNPTASENDSVRSQEWSPAPVDGEDK